MPHLHLALCTAAVALAAGTSIGLAQDNRAKEDDSRRPKLSMRARPQVVVAPGRVVLTVELAGGADDFEEYYCPSIEWKWGDDTSSESTVDCEPFESGKSQIKRRYTVEHAFRRAGSYKVYFYMKRNDKVLGSASTMVQVQPGITPGI